MRFGLTVAALVLLTSTQGIADVTRMHVCERASITRVVELQSDGETGLPCRVVYKRPMEDQSATSLWNAKSDANYCAQKYNEFVAKIQKKHNWSCTAKLSGPTDTLATSNNQQKTLEAVTSPTESGLPTSRPNLTEQENSGPAVAQDKTATLPSPAKPVNSLKKIPNLSAALPVVESRQGSVNSLSMTLIRQLIPSGQYIVDDQIPHRGNTALCPADGFYIWSTKRPGTPVFEMGPDESFQFDLSQLTDEPLLDGADGAINLQCHEKVAAGYCSDNMYTGSTALHPQLSRHFGCGPSAGNTVQRSPLVLFRSIVNQSSLANACRPTPSPHHMALAPAGDPEAINGIASTDGIELVILPSRSKNAAITNQDGAICRYIRG